MFAPQLMHLEASGLFLVPQYWQIIIAGIVSSVMACV
jgi:hypothetical protein